MKSHGRPRHGEGRAFRVRHCNSSATHDALAAIMGAKKNVSYIVGGKDGVPEPDNGYRLTNGYGEHAGRLVIMTEIRLYANTHAPTYHVVVGTVAGQEAIARAKRKLDRPS
jgi:hypothetical protein